ncbi:MAG TPA: RagB/SusD family nutrient uptake outer membrane protein [Arachidicoccus sp.]|nr:RagB/SusD family nutrient uptake outer membrane protein [Arachidicoccus sp.]
MKYFKNIVWLFLGVLLFAGCRKDLLTTIPNDRISTEIFWKTDRDATLAANAVYTYMAESTNHFMSWDGMTDIGFTHSPQSPESFILSGQFDALNGRVSSDWDSYYAGIHAANSFLANVDRIETSNQALIDRLKGEVRALRAYFYIRLAALYGDVPLVTTEISLQESKNLERTPVDQVWNFIATELSESAAVLPVSQKETGRITKGAALALKARAMLYAGNFREAAIAAQAVMDLKVYALYPDFKNLFSYAAENNKEVVLDIQYIKDTYSNNAFGLLAPKSQNGSSLYVPTKNLVDAFEMNTGMAINEPGSGYDPYNPYVNRDPRLQYSVFVPGDLLPNNTIFNPKPGSLTGDDVISTFVVSPTGFNVKKYVNKEDLSTPGNCGINIILLRYAEVLLTYAEAKIELNELDATVYAAINEIRSRPDVNMPLITAGKSQVELRSIVRHEREVELAFEGLRFFDVRRWKIADKVMPGKVYGITYIDNGGKLKTIEVAGWNNVFNSRNYLWPVPQNERDLNPKLGQNLDW